MNIKRYALFLFERFYPSGGMDDLASFHDTQEAAIAKAARDKSDYFQVVDTQTFQVVAHGCDGVPDTQPWQDSLD